jgi:ABC-2 type transport system permease protein
MALLTGVGLRRLLVYRADFLVGMIGFLLRIGLNVLLLEVIFAQAPALAGWTLDQALLLLGLAMCCRGLDHTFTDQLWELARKLVQRGELVRYLIRPVSPLFTLLSERFLYPDGLGELLGGVAVTGYAVSRLAGAGADLGGPGRWLLTAGLVGCGALVYACVKLVLASAAFWTVTSLQLMTSVYEVSEAARYPLQVFPAPIRGVLVGILPFAFTGFVPADYLLHGPGPLAAAAPLVAAALVLAAAAVWRRGLDRFEAVGL